MTDFIQQSKKLHFDLESKEYWPCACVIDHNDDTRRHHAMLDVCFDIIRDVQIENCLSVGDSRARDAAYAKSIFRCHATASDLNTSKLDQAVKDGFIDAVEDIDVESIPCPDSSIDLVIAKETFHHWPRPFIGLYEMIRVSRKYVAILEPYDCLPSCPSPYVEESQYHDSYEEIGNYKYQLSLRELLKAAWAMGLPGVAARGFNDPYQPGQTIEEWLKKKDYLDRLGEAGERQFNLMAIVIAKTRDSFSALNKSYSKIYVRPLNPYRE